MYKWIKLNYYYHVQFWCDVNEKEAQIASYAIPELVP